MFKEKRFWSQLFKRYIKPDEYDYFERVHAELLFRIRELEQKECDSLACKEELRKYYDALYKFEKPPEKPIL